MILSDTLRSISIASVAMPLALGDATAGSTEQAKNWRHKAPITDQQTAAITLLDHWRVIPFATFTVGSAQTSVDAVATSPIQHTNTNTSGAASNDATVPPLAFDWVIPPLARIGELLQLPPDDLPNETPLTQAAVAAAVQIVLDLQDSKAPAPQVVARGDGGLQLAWYTSQRDLEIEVRPQGSADIIEFDGAKTQRSAYSIPRASSALTKIQECLEGASQST